MEFKDRLKVLRKQKGITQSELATVLSYGYTAISNYESGRNEPSIKDLKKIGEYFDVSMDYLLCVNDIKNPYMASDENKPDEDFTQKYASLSPDGKKQLKSLMDWLISQHPELMTEPAVEAKAAQDKNDYNTNEETE